MKKKIILVLTLILLFVCLAVPVKADVNKKIVNNLCRGQKKVVKIINRHDYKTIVNRKGKKYILVEKVVSISRGNYGIERGKYYIAYNRYVKKGKKVISYIIYNPKTNYCDDVLFVVDNKMYR